MPFKKFKPIKQWGRYNTRSFKHLLRLKHKTDADVLQIDQEVKQLGIKIQDPLSPDFFKQFEKREENFTLPMHLRKKSLEV